MGTCRLGRMRSLCLVLVFLISSAWSAPTSPLYVVVGPLNIKSLIGNKAHTLYDDYGLIIGGGIKGSAVMVKKGASLEVAENIEGSQIDNSGKQSVGGNLQDSELVNAVTGNMAVGGNVDNVIADLLGDTDVKGNVESSEIFVGSQGDTNVDGHLENTNVEVE